MGYKLTWVYVWATQVRPTLQSDRPDIDSFTLSTSVASGVSGLHAVWTGWDYVYLWRNTSNLRQCSATGWDLSNFNSSIISSLSYQSRWLWCKPDWTKLYNSFDNGNIYEITMGTAYSLSWATVSSNSMWLACCGIGLSYDGTKLYHWVWDNNYQKQFIEYTLATPRDVSSRWTWTARTVSAIDWTGHADAPFIYQVAVSPTGKKMYFSADQWKIYQYNLSTPYDWNTATYYGVMDTWFGARCTFQFKDDWTRIIAWNLSDQKLYQYDAS